MFIKIIQQTYYNKITQMMAFNDYFGYQQFNYPQRTSRKLKRTEFSQEKLADLSDNSRSKKKQIAIPLLKNKSLKTASPARLNRNSIKRSPFKAVEKKQTTFREYGNKDKSNQKREQRCNHTYQRYFSQDCKTKKIVVEKRKDSTIRKYFERKKQENLFQNRLQNKISPTSRSQPQIYLRTQKTNYLKGEKIENLYELEEKIEKQLYKKGEYSTTDENAKKLNKPIQIEKISMESDSVFNEEEEDCVLIDHREQQSEDFSEEIDDYQIKKSISIHHKIKNSIDSDNSNNSYNYKMKISPTSIKKGHEPAKNQTIAKIQMHSNLIGKLLQFICETNQFYQKNSFAFNRQNYLLKRMYYQEIRKVLMTLKENGYRTNCFRLENCQITEEELRKCKSQNYPEIEMKMKLIERQSGQLEEMLQRQSDELIEKSPNDPYLHMDKQSFEPQLINELFEQINSISEKLVGRAAVNNRGAQQERRYSLICIVFLVGQLCMVREEKQTELVGNNYSKYYQENQDRLLDLVQRFQDMPL